MLWQCLQQLSLRGSPVPCCYSTGELGQHDTDSRCTRVQSNPRRTTAFWEVCLGVGGSALPALTHQTLCRRTHGAVVDLFIPV